MVGNVFGTYELRLLLGRGGMGEVYRAYDRSHQREVAVKLLIESLSKDREYRARFEREARIAAGLREQHIIPIHRFGEIDNRLFIDMRLVDGEDLGKLLAREGALAPGRAVRIAAQVAAALDAAHLAGLVHRDVKPANVLIARTATAAADSVYLADFGIARAGDAGTNERLTMTGVTIGTPDYMAPERFTDGTADHRADIYALGCMLYEMLSGHKPFAAEGVLALAYKHVNEEAPRLCAARPDLPRALDEVVHRSMAKDPVHRYRSAGELAAAAEAALAPAGRSVPQPGLPRRLVGGLLGAVLSLVALGAFEAVAYTTHTHPGPGHGPADRRLDALRDVHRRGGRDRPPLRAGGGQRTAGGIVGGFLGGLVHWASGPEFFEIDAINAPVWIEPMARGWHAHVHRAEPGR
ncbi:MAG: serine/threonine-protein kinase [Pseudonocardia sp.]